MAIICKFKVDSIKTFASQKRKRSPEGTWVKPDNGGQGFVMEPCVMAAVEMSPVYARDDPQHINSHFWDATPSGKLEMCIANPQAIAGLDLMKEYHLVIQDADLAEVRIQTKPPAPRPPVWHRPRNRTDLQTVAEEAIRAAVAEVEKTGADPLLTDAVNLLAQALDKIADFVDIRPQDLTPFDKTRVSGG